MGNKTQGENVIIGGGERYPTHFNGMSIIFLSREKPLSFKK